jgi:hypothetical protein
MTNRIETGISVIGGFMTTALVSNHLLEDMAMKSIIAILTGFLGAMAGLSAKLLFNYIKDKFTKKDGVEK